ncbi:MAG: putative CAP domain [Streblomastix strix]|uniref:Putative CAP domain n=1 Tax=Streblomastix strix TaxID=222440 RepID=A0A5J4W060_9EUKA|nr:MAG: putative CAP domain [Streblomastix strix]
MGNMPCIHPYRLDEDLSRKREESDKFLLEAAKTNEGVVSPSERVGREILKLTNEFRIKNRKPPCIWSREIYEISRKHSEDMAKHKKGFDHSGFSERLRSIPYRTQANGENIYKTSEEKGVATQAVNGWINSKGHKANMLNDFNLCGIGTAHSSVDGMVYVTQIFAKAK